MYEASETCDESHPVDRVNHVEASTCFSARRRLASPSPSWISTTKLLSEQPQISERVTCSSALLFCRHVAFYWLEAFFEVEVSVEIVALTGPCSRVAGSIEALSSSPAETSRRLLQGRGASSFVATSVQSVQPQVLGFSGQLPAPAKSVQLPLRPAEKSFRHLPCGAQVIA